MNQKQSGLILIICLLLVSITTTAVSAQSPYDWTDEDAAGLAFLGFGLIACVSIAWFIIAIVIAIWVYRDAEKRGKSGALWLIIIIITGLIGLIIWFVVRPPIGGEKATKTSSERRCPNCGKIIPEDARVCPYCSKKFEE
jgi:uncharacterized membrane protein